MGTSDFMALQDVMCHKPFTCGFQYDRFAFNTIRFVSMFLRDPFRSDASTPEGNASRSDLKNRNEPLTIVFAGHWAARLYASGEGPVLRNLRKVSGLGSPMESLSNMMWHPSLYHF